MNLFKLRPKNVIANITFKHLKNNPKAINFVFLIFYKLRPENVIANTTFKDLK